MPVFYRMVRSHHAATAMDGEGARRFGGRWNPPGVPVAYLTVSRAQAALEILVHAGREVIQLEWSLLSVELPEKWIEKPAMHDLPDDWDTMPSSLVSRHFGADWVRAGGKPAILLPSAIIPEEQILMINVQHPHFAKLKISQPEQFAFDHRLA